MAKRYVLIRVEERQVLVSSLNDEEYQKILRMAESVSLGGIVCGERKEFRIPTTLCLELLDRAHQTELTVNDLVRNLHERALKRAERTPSLATIRDYIDSFKN